MVEGGVYMKDRLLVGIRRGNHGDVFADGACWS